MKLQHFSVGERFEYEGVIYVKTGPLTACGETGGQRMIPRHAMLRPVAAPGSTAAPETVPPAQGRVLQAFEQFYRTCEMLVTVEAQAELQAARQRFLQEIG
ncbi:MAG: hypothetical protein PHT48_07150 [Dechloromonas sp.]|nr:hypothetical protein [Dechloromonas sp.]